MKRLIIISFLLLPFAFSLLPSLAQPLNSIYDNKALVSFEKYIYSSDSIVHTSVRPLLVSDMRKAFDYDKVWERYIKAQGTGLGAQSEETSLLPPPGGSSSRPLALSPSRPPSLFHPHPLHLRDLLFNTNLISVNGKNYSFTIDPLFDFGYGYDFEAKRETWVNTRGFLIEGTLGKDFAFSTRFYETQSKVPLWVDNFVKARGIMPGQGRVKTFGNNAWDYGVSQGYISWSPGKFFNFQFGQGKQFFGDGYRSLLLSDVSAAHPYAMITTTFWKIKYVNLYSQFSNPDVIANKTGGGDPVYAKKFSTMHYLSFAPSHKWNISLFEAIVWQASDSSFYRGFDISYLNPVIFYRPVEFNLGDGDNALIGTNIRYSIFKKTALYGQFLIDEFKIKEMTNGKGWAGNKYAWQLGLKSFDAFGIANLELQAEYNFIRPYTYSHYILTQSYSNAKQPLAHPDGANTKEAVVIARYSYKRLYLNLKYVNAVAGFDPSGQNYGKDIFKTYTTAVSEYGNKTGQGISGNLNQVDFTASYLVNPVTDMNLFLGATIRRESLSSVKTNYTWVNFGFRTSLRNLYEDIF